MLPNESLLQVLHFADYRTLVLVKLAAAPFLRLATKFAEELACRRRFSIDCCGSRITYKDVTLNTQEQLVHYERDNHASLVAACRKVAEVIGPHAVGQLKIYVHRDMWNTPGVDVIFEAAPPLAHAENVVLCSFGASAIGRNFDAFMSNFAGMRPLRLWLDNDVFRHFGWMYLCMRSGPEFRLPKFIVTIKLIREAPPAEIESSIEKLVRYCATHPLPSGEELYLAIDFMQGYFSVAFGLRIVELLKNSVRQVSFMMKTTGDGRELIQDESDYTVETDGATTRYESKKHGVVVELRGWITIRSTAEVHP